MVIYLGSWVTRSGEVAARCQSLRGGFRIAGFEGLQCAVNLCEGFFCIPGFGELQCVVNLREGFGKISKNKPEKSEISDHTQVLRHLASDTSETSEPVQVSSSHASVASVCVSA